MNEPNKENYKHTFSGTCEGIGEELKNFVKKQHEYMENQKIHEYILDLAKKGVVVIDHLIVFGLMKKGYSFENDNQINDLIREKGRIESAKFSSTYFIDDNPFLKVHFLFDISQIEIDKLKEEINIRYEFL